MLCRAYGTRISLRCLPSAEALGYHLPSRRAGLRSLALRKLRAVANIILTARTPALTLKISAISSPAYQSLTYRKYRMGWLPQGEKLLIFPLASLQEE